MTVMEEDYNYLSDNGQISLNNFYEALAWQGLRIIMFKHGVNLSEEKKNEIDEALNNIYIFQPPAKLPKLVFMVNIFYILIISIVIFRPIFICSKSQLSESLDLR